jgi:hypothetical protein
MIKPDPMISSCYGAGDLVAMNNRQLWLDYLYELDQRFKPDHPQHGIYTGLAKAYALLPDHDA